MAGRNRCTGERCVQIEAILFYFLLFVFFLDLWKLDRRCSSEQKAKLVYAKRATHRYQYLNLLSNFKR